METIRNYLENIFSVLPKNVDIIKLKADMLDSMSEKYNELKADGKSENEAIGIVISEFGNIDEIVKELGIDINEQKKSSNAIEIDEKTADKYIQYGRKIGLNIGIGVLICILGIIPMVVFGIAEKYEAYAFLSMFLIVGIGVAIIIFTALKYKRPEYEKKELSLTPQALAIVREGTADFAPKFALSLVINITALIITVGIFIFILMMHEDVMQYEAGAMAFLFSSSAIWVSRLIYYGCTMESYSVLLQENEFAVEKKREKKKNEAIVGAYWMIITAAYLLTSFITEKWHITWLFFVIGGVLQGVIEAMISVFESNKNND